MVTIYQCQKCGQIVAKGGLICEVAPKCPKCGSWLIMQIDFSPRYWYLYLKQFYQSKFK